MLHFYCDTVIIHNVMILRLQMGSFCFQISYYITNYFYIVVLSRGGGATSKVGGTNKKGHFLGKKGTYKGKSQSENKQFLDFNFRLPIFVSLYTSYKILLFKASYLAVGCDGRKNHLRARKNIRFVRTQCENYIL